MTARCLRSPGGGDTQRPVRLFASLWPNTRRAARSSPPFLFPLPMSHPKPYWHFGSPSFSAGAGDVDPMQIEQVFFDFSFGFFTNHPSTALVMYWVLGSAGWEKRNLTCT